MIEMFVGAAIMFVGVLLGASITRIQKDVDRQGE